MSFERRDSGKPRKISLNNVGVYEDIVAKFIQSVRR
jgi:hypothetical protein